MRTEVTFEKDEEVGDDEFKQEQWYWNFTDGGLFCPIIIGDDHVIIMEIDGSIDRWDREDTIFNPESVWREIVPVKLDEFTFLQQ